MSKGGIFGIECQYCGHRVESSTWNQVKFHEMAHLVDKHIVPWIRIAEKTAYPLKTVSPGDRPSWDEYFMEIARAVSSRSDCERAKVGAVVVGTDHRIRGTGYNGAPSGKPGCESCPRRESGVAHGSQYTEGEGRCVAVHAEANALLYTDRADLNGSTVYVTVDPCAECVKLLLASGISRVVGPDGEVQFS